MHSLLWHDSCQRRRTLKCGFACAALLIALGLPSAAQQSTSQPPVSRQPGSTAAVLVNAALTSPADSPGSADDPAVVPAAPSAAAPAAAMITPRVERPSRSFPTKMWLSLTGVNIGASYFVSQARWYGAHQCQVREELKRNPAQMRQQALGITLGIDAGVSFVSWRLMKHHPGIATYLPLTSASAQFGAGATLYSAGCM